MCRNRFSLARAVLLVLFGLSPALHADEAMNLPLMPMPAQVELGTGVFVVDGSFGIAASGYTEPRLVRAQERFLQRLSSETGILFQPQPGGSKPHFFINAKGKSEPVQRLGEDESYRLVVTPGEVHLEAANPLGVLHGMQTFLQLVRGSKEGFVVPAVTIEDQPRFPWRGLMIDVGRHFMPIAVLKRNLDGMEAVKLNVFHLHISENQGFRIESRRYPLLQEKGSDGLFYTQSEIRELIEYARDRGIRVVPEFDMPGHATSWFVGYPELASGKGPYQIEREWGVFDPAMDPTRDSTYKFIDGLLGEMTALFPDAYFHIGGDECNGKEWDANPRIQTFMHEHGLKDNGALQAYFTAKVQGLVAKHHKTVEGWDEVLLPGTPKEVVIQSWRGQESLARAAHEGYQGILSAGYYLDLNQPAVEHYLVDPMGGDAAKLPAEEQKRILGGEAAMWSEFVSPENIDSRVWPRLAPIAERLWSPQGVRDVSSMYARMAVISEQLVHYGIRPAEVRGEMLRRIAGGSPVEPVRVLAEAVEPPKEYERGSLQAYTQFTPLNRLIDAVPPESEAARRFGVLVDGIAAKTTTPEQVDEAKEWLVRWRDNDQRLQALLPESALMSDLAPPSTHLRKTAEIGLKALEALQSGQGIAAGEKQEQMLFLETAKKPQGVLLDVVAPHVEKLVNAASGH